MDDCLDLVGEILGHDTEDYRELFPELRADAEGAEGQGVAEDDDSEEDGEIEAFLAKEVEAKGRIKITAALRTRPAKTEATTAAATMTAKGQTVTSKAPRTVVVTLKKTNCRVCCAMRPRMTFSCWNRSVPATRLRVKARRHPDAACAHAGWWITH